ncbi:putative heat shock protein hslv [Cardiosporidium cionae]|uniref:Heat shock protein hslv n=1 Tax=Cardiosporidium cionae TaxID=476202 RepID=A0ABQ7J676_9APIC|nr:putative heat shock protein hslv [Cardiosporidium cionae]|eukprot:KAF8819190.1 putative heat shock protein hslv [Cardiosporidium cionae]
MNTALLRSSFFFGHSLQNFVPSFHISTSRCSAIPISESSPFQLRASSSYIPGFSHGYFSQDSNGVPSMLGVGPMRGTTILCVRKNDKVCIAGDGMVSQGNMIVKPNARKIRRLKGNVILGFAGTTADCFTLVDRLEERLEEYPGQLLRACVELAKHWRMDRYLRHLQAVLVIADERLSLQVTGNGDVLESHDGILGVGSGGPYAIAAARALYDIEGFSAQAIATKAMDIASDMCCHTNNNILNEVIDSVKISSTATDE